MATYAAMIEIMDDGIGQIVEAFREKGTLEIPYSCSLATTVRPWRAAIWDS